ncbi:MAG: methionyl-tRNA formyltransferase, partial [Candidatus Pacebacteria bacterium]|nr:methionyl-tRNA formyltransferase [Candidatus Paceibacterota bacterium]
MDFKFAFWGTPEVGSKTLEILKNSGYIPKIIITSPDKPQGRKLVITPPPVKVWAESNNIQCLQPEELTEDLIDRLRQEDCGLFIVVAYGKIMPEKLINLPRLGSINIHYSLLPKLRGASPVES